MENPIEVEEEEHFEDFTTASDWELFTANLELLLTEWLGKPLEPEHVKLGWVIISEKLSFLDTSMQIQYYRRIPPPSSEISHGSANLLDTIRSTSAHAHLPPYLYSILEKAKEFPPSFSPHVISELFSVKEFGVIIPNGQKPLEDESKLKMLMSSICMALNNTNSNFPMFVQYHPWKQDYFCGIAESSGIRTSFQMIHLKRFAKHYNHLSGLVALFRSKIGSKLSSTPVEISVHFFYTMRIWHQEYTFETEYTCVPEYLKNNALPSAKASSEVFPACNACHAFTSFLPFGCSDDPFSSLQLVVGWPSLSEDVVVDTPTYTDLDPELAPDWFFSLKPNTELDFRLNEMLESVWNLLDVSKTIEEILGKKLGKEVNETHFTSAFDRITVGVSPLPVVNRVISNVNRAQKQLLFSPLQYTDLPPIEKEDMDAIVFYMFPDAAVPKSRYPYPKDFEWLLHFERPDIQRILEQLQSVKSAPMGGLAWRIAILISYYTNAAGHAGIAQIWAELIIELRFRWENSIFIPGLEPGLPNSGTCLLNQKLQMLNCCIEKKLFREKKQTDDPNEGGSDEEADSEEEFFDCADSLPDSEEISGRLPKPSGRLQKCGKLRLLKTGEPLYIPLTQDPAPLTEDGFEVQTKMLVELGDDEEGTEQRAKLMSATLSSDMQSFKAANPGCVLEDFVRWYSPRDWVENEGMNEFGNKTGELSVRMKMPGNLWLQVWSATTPIPARRQKRLFDDTKEAEGILIWLRTRTLRDICQLIFPCLAHASTLKILEEANKLKVNLKIPSTIVQHLTQLTRSLGNDVLKTHHSSISGFAPDNERKSDSNAHKFSLLSSLIHMEKEICQIGSFQQKFPSIDLKLILETALTEPSNQKAPILPFLVPYFIRVDGGFGSPTGQRVRDIFLKEASVHDLEGSIREFKFGVPAKKVVALKYAPVKGSGHSSDSNIPQRMTCSVKSDEIKIAGTFSIQTELG